MILGHNWPLITLNTKVEENKKSTHQATANIFETQCQLKSGSFKVKGNTSQNTNAIGKQIILRQNSKQLFLCSPSTRLFQPNCNSTYIQSPIGVIIQKATQNYIVKCSGPPLQENLSIVNRQCEVQSRFQTDPTTQFPLEKRETLEILQ